MKKEQEEGDTTRHQKKQRLEPSTDLVDPQKDGGILKALMRRCPIANSQKWATAVVYALNKRHSDDRKALLAHSRLLCSSLTQQNGEDLAKLDADDLVSLSLDELGAGTEAVRMRQASKRGGWGPARAWPIHERFEAGSAWQKAQSKQLEIVLLNEHDSRIFAASGFGAAIRVQVITGNIVDLSKAQTHVDAFISPANTCGNMDGGVDRAFADFFGWSYGLPYEAVNPLQLAIDRAKGKESARLPIGEALLVRNSAPPHLIAAPTMSTPGKIEVESRTVYGASRAAFSVWKDSPDVNIVRVPAFGTGWGEVPVDVAASQMWEAFYDTFK